MVTERSRFLTQLRESIPQAQIVDVIPASFTEDDYDWLTTPQTVTVASDSAADADAGLGVQTVELNMVRPDSYLTDTITVTLDGTTPVPVTHPLNPSNLWWRCNGLRAVTGGATAQVTGAVGTILVTSNDAKEMAQIPALGSVWGGCIYTWPKDEFFSVLGIDMSIHDPQNANNDVLIGSLHSRRPGEDVWNREILGRILTVDDPNVGFAMEDFLFADGTDLRIRALSNSTSTDVIGRMHLHRKARGRVL